MKRLALLVYQFAIGFSDTVTGALLLVAPVLTLHLMGLRAPADSLVYISFIGAFVFAVGLACMYGFFLMATNSVRPRIETVWLLTAFARASVALFVFAQISDGALERGWITVALSDGVCVLIQGVGLWKGWLAHVAC